MNENINLYDILNGCPKEMPLYSSLIGDVVLREVCPDKIVVHRYLDTGNYYVYGIDGRYYSNADSECTLFPSRGQRDWSKFKSPVKRFDPKGFKPFDKVLVRPLTSAFSSKGQPWNIDFFSYIVADDNTLCAGGVRKYCIPFNEDTEHLLGTSCDCPEFYKWWKK